MAHIFLSYAQKEKSRVKPLVDALEVQGWSVWWDRKLRPGEAWDRVIDREIRAANCVLVVWTEVSVKSDWVKEEAEHGQKRGLLVSVLLDDVEPPWGFRRQQAANLTSWDTSTADPEFQLLVEGIAAKAPRSPQPRQSQQAYQQRSSAQHSTTNRPPTEPALPHTTGLTATPASSHWPALARQLNVLDTYVPLWTVGVGVTAILVVAFVFWTWRLNALATPIHAVLSSIGLESFTR